MTTRVFTNPKDAFRSSDGASVNSSGKLYFREPGAGSTTLKAVYANKELTTQLANPVTLDASGRAPAIFLNGDYNVQLTDLADVQIWRIDNYQPPEIEGQFQDWDASLTYAVNDYVRYTDGNYYISLQSGNSGNIPGSSPTYWTQAFFLTVYNSSTTYAADEVVYYQGNIYTSLQGSNTGNTPDTSFTYWARPGVSVPTVSGYTGSIVKYYRSGAYENLVISTLMSNDTWRSFGPTGSGADTEWAALDAIPSNATSINLSVRSSVNRVSGSILIASLAVSARTNGSVNEFNINDIQVYGSSTQQGTIKSIAVGEIPVSASNVFDLKYFEVNSDSLLIDISLLGFSVAEA